MTFTEAAIEVLRREGKPLHFKKIAEIAVRESLLDHVGKIPDDTMADQLVAHCRLPHEDRKVIPILSGTFALVEWGMDEDPTGLENLIEVAPDSELPYRGRERHPIPLRDLGRGGRTERRRREEEGPRPRRFPPPAEVAYEILAGAGHALGVTEIAAQGAERLLMPDAFVRDVGALRSALLEDNHRRESAGRRGLFQIDGDTVTLVAQPEPGEKPAAPAAAARAPVTAADARRSGLAALRRRLRECDPATIEHVVCRMLEKLGFKEIKVAKRGREHVIYTGRRRLGLADVRHGIRILRSGADVGRRDVTELRRDLGHYGAQIGAVVSVGEAGREARGEAAAPGQLPVLLLCGEALAESFAEAGVGCVPVVVPEVDEAFFRTAAELAEQEEIARKARREERERREGREEREPREPREPREERRREDRRDERREDARAVQEIEAGSPAEAERAEKELPEPRILEVAATLAEAEVAGVVPAALDADAEGSDAEGDDDGDEAEGEGDEDGGEDAPAAAGAAAEPGQAGERRRRRRRRRRRGGRGRTREGGEREAGAAAGGGQEGGAKGAAPEVAPAPEPSAPPAGGSGPEE